MDEDEGSDEYFGSPKSGSVLADAMMRKAPERRATQDDIERWTRESGMNSHTRADPLGDEAGEYTSDIDVAEKEDKSLRGSVY
jgi:hypothetical protein